MSVIGDPNIRSHCGSIQATGTTGSQQMNTHSTHPTEPPPPTPSHPPISSHVMFDFANQVQAMEEDFARFGASVEVVRYGGEAKHAFTRPEKTEQEDRDAGLSYCKHADDDSWRRVVALLEEELKQ